MNEEFYSSIKLVSGEEIFAITSTDDDHPDTLILSDPVCIETIHGPRGSFVRVEPWMHIPDDNFYFVKMDKVITMTEVEMDHDMVEYYTNYLIEQAEERELGGTVAKGGRKVKPTKTMGYLGNVDQAKEKLEQCLALEMDPKAGIATHV